MLDCVVIGAGQAGLSTSRHLTLLGVDHVVLERGRVGEMWQSARWDSFFLNTPNWCTQLPGLAPNAEPDAFASLAEIAETLTEYARAIAAPVRTAEVRALRASDRGFELTLADDTVAARAVVVATGAFQQPLLPATVANAPAGILHLHTSAYRNPGELPDGGVLVVGSGQSGCEIGLELLEAGRHVHLAIGRCGWSPRRYRGREFMRWMVDAGAMDETIDALPRPSARVAGNVAVSGSHGGRDCNPLVLEEAGAVLHGRLAGFGDGHAYFEDDLDAGLAFGLTFERDLCHRFDEYAAAAGLDLPEHPLRERAPGADAPSPELSLAGAAIGTVLWAGGYRPAFSWIELPIFDELGFPRAVRGVTDVAGLAFVGLPWLHTRKSPLLLGVGEDAEHVAGAVAEHLENG